jgi:hypothetical protein
MKLGISWILLGVMFFVLAVGGCGGGGGDGGNPTPTPTPTPPSEDTADFDTLVGTWVASAGSGTATGPGGPYTLALDSGRATFSIVNHVSATRVLARVTDAFVWKVFKNSRHVNTIPLSATNEEGYVDYRGNKVYRYTFASGGYIDVTATSATSASVHEAGIFYDVYDEYQYNGTYTLTKE